MAVTRTRTTITIEPHVLEMYQRVAKASRQSVSRCMGDWLADTADGAMAIALQAEKARTRPLQAMHELQLYAAAMQEGAAELVEKVKLAKEGGTQVENAVRRGSPPPTPPSSNTGGKVDRRDKAGVSK